MIGVHVNDWLIDHDLQEAADIMNISKQAIYKMIKKERDVRVFRRDGEWVFIEIKELS